MIADKFAKVSQEYEPLEKEDIDIPEFDDSSIPSFTAEQVQQKLLKLKTNKSVPPGDIQTQADQTVFCFLLHISSIVLLDLEHGAGFTNLRW